jgi:hypothetical protein
LHQDLKIMRSLIYSLFLDWMSESLSILQGDFEFTCAKRKCKQGRYVKQT